MSARLDIASIRKDFPILGTGVVYLDNAATTQKPLRVIESLTRFYSEQNANVHRGLYKLSQEATRAYEGARATVASFLNAAEPAEIVFLRGATEAINLVAHSYGRTHLLQGDEVLITGMEHHSNIVPWQIVCKERDAILRVAPVTMNGEVDLDAFEKSLTERTKLVSIIHVSNVLGTINPVKRMVEMARDRGIPTMIDGAQAAPHIPINVQDLGCDFYAVSGHKMFGPTGIGALYGRREWLERLPPYQGGGEMILSVKFEGTTYNKIPHKFEAGTPNIADTIAFAEAIEYLRGVGYKAIEDYEGSLMKYALAKLQEAPGVSLVGNPEHRAGAISFTVDGVHPHDVGTILDQRNIAIRAGHHCAQPLVEFFGLPATARASFAFYNTREEVNALVEGLEEVVRLFS